MVVETSGKNLSAVINSETPCVSRIVFVAKKVKTGPAMAL